MPVEFNFETDERIDWFDPYECGEFVSSGDEYLDRVIEVRGYLSAEVLG
jgi:hypothetical protein